MAKPPKDKEPGQLDLLEKNPGDNSELFENKEGTDSEVTEPPKKPEDDASLALQKQVEELTKSEKLQRERAERLAQEKDQAVKDARRRSEEITKFQQEAVQSRLDAIGNAIAAAQAEAEAAQKDITAAAEIGDFKAQSEAYRKLARAEANLARLEDGKIALEEEKKAAPQPTEKVDDDPLEKTNLPELAKGWLRAHPDYLQDPRKNAKIQALHWDVIDEGHAPFSQAYFESLEQHLGLREKPKKDAPTIEDDDAEPGRGAVVSAPVSREPPRGSNGRRPGEIRLTNAQREAAKAAGITETEYAKQHEKLLKLKEEGYYQQS